VSLVKGSYESPEVLTVSSNALKVETQLDIT